MKRSILSMLIAASCISLSYGQADELPQGEGVRAGATVTDLSTQAANLYTNQWVHVDRDGFLRGSVVALSGKEVSLTAGAKVDLMQFGEVVTSDGTDIAGEFLLEGVKPGVYTLVARSNDSIAIFALTVLDSVAGKHLPNSVEARLMSTAGGRVAEILDASSMPGSSVSPSYIVPTQDPLKGSRKSQTTHRINISADGSIAGSLSKPLSSEDMSKTVVYVFKDGVEVARTRATRTGKFTLTNLKPGCYGIVAAGDLGVAAVGFCAVAPGLAMMNANGNRFVTVQDSSSDSLNLEMGEYVAQPKVNPDAPPTEEVIASEPYPMAAPGFGGGPMGGGGSIGGGGSGGGFGRLGGIAGLAGLAAGIAAIASNDNNNSPIQSPIAP